MATPQINGSSALKGKEYRVITIPAREQRQDVKLRVAAYARVSSSSEDQLNSFAAQNRYYTDLIAGKENWQQVDIYADEGITGTSAEKRDDFQRMLADCRRGLIDRVLVKSISRFARNTKECLEIIRELKLLGISVYFEKENIDTGKMTGEMMTAMFAAFAQAESESISGNMRWSYQKRMQNGTFITCKYPFGYRLVAGQLVIYEPEAKVVRLIFYMFLAGHSSENIAQYITSLGVPTRDGRPRWQVSTVLYILRNERYVGDALLQKWYSTDTFPTQKKVNHGEKDQYFLTNSIPPIIDRQTFQATGALLLRKAQKIHTSHEGKSVFSKQLYCHCCGSLLRKKTNRGNTYWVCRTHFVDVTRCPLPPIPETEIKAAFLRLYFNLKHHSTAILDDTLASLQAIRNRRMLWSEDIISLNKQISDLSSQNQLLAELKQQGVIDPDIFIYQSNELAQQFRDARLKKERLLDQNRDSTIDQTKEIMAIMDTGPEFLETFDEGLFCELIDKIIVESNEKIRFRLKNGLELVEAIERTVR